MKSLDQITKKADGFLKKYDLHYTVDGEPVLWEIVTAASLKVPSDVAARPSAVEIIARFEDGDLLLCREFRFSVNCWCWEFPGGIIDPGETPLEAAIRELKEETGLEVVSVDRVLPASFLAVGITDTVVVPVCLTVRGTITPSHTALEDIAPVKMSPDAVRQLLTDPDLKINQTCLMALSMMV